ncbi:MAG: hypothetical protein JO372_06100 [Solirubrobacterales bacterium]|nr:hypothetical protein [Solirubrobacterales bacterium]
MTVGARRATPSRILVTDAQDRPALAAIRCLHEAGYLVGATANTRIAPGLWSRDCTVAGILPDPSAGVDQFIAQLRSVLVNDQYDVLVPGTDETLFAVSARREQLPSSVALGLPDHDVVKRALDKACLANEAATAGLATPDQRVCDRLEEALDAARGFGYPVLLKGVTTIAESDGRLIRYPTRFVADEPTLLDLQAQIGRCIIQRRVAGTLMSFAGVVTERGMLASVFSRYHRMWPPSAGQASFLETVAAPEALSERVGALLAAIGWKGLFQLQLIECEDGAIRAIDLNPRLYGSISIAEAAGAPLPELWCAWVLGEGPKPAVARPGVHYRMEDMDARHILWLVRQGDYRGAARAVLPRRNTTHAYFRARDPLPLLLRCVELADHKWRRRGARTPAQ